MRTLQYEFNGQVYKTRAEAPRSAKIVLVKVATERPKYNAKRVARLRELARKGE